MVGSKPRQTRKPAAEYILPLRPIAGTLVYNYYYVILNSWKSQTISSTAQIAAFLQGFLAMAERGGLNSQLVRGRPPAGERWHVSCFQRALAIKGIASVYEGSNDLQIARN